MKFKVSSRVKWCLVFLAAMVANLQLSFLVVKYLSRMHTAASKDQMDKMPGDVVIAHSMLSKPQNSLFSTSLQRVDLPSFTKDDTEFIFSALIERSFESWSLHVTVLMLCHHLLTPEGKNGVEKVHPVTKDVWSQAISNFRLISYTGNGQREANPAFHCKITNSKVSSPYISPGFFIPNRLTTDPNANRRMDILRCPMEHNKVSYLNFARSDGEVAVEILRDDEPIIKFSIPWSTRRTGYMFSAPQNASKLDAWVGFDPTPFTRDESKSFSSESVAVHVCVADTKRYPSKDIIPLYLEFISHHLLVGASHIYFPVSVGWKSPHMAKYLELFRSYIDEGKLSIVSHSGDGIDMVHSIAGLTWNRLTIKVFQVNACLYQAKGVAEHLLVVDIDEFFIPRVGFSSIADVIKSTYSSTALSPPAFEVNLEDLKGNWTGGKGWADGDAHPFCFLTLSSEVYLRAQKPAVKENTEGLQFQPLPAWIGERYKHGPESLESIYTRKWGYTRAILPTRIIFQGALSSGGACLLPREWRACQFHEMNKEFCGDNSETMRMGVASDGHWINFRRDHTFHEAVLGQDAKAIDRDTEAVLYHYLIHRRRYEASDEAMAKDSEYYKRFFPAVLADLKERSLDLVLVAADEPSSDAGPPREPSG